MSFCTVWIDRISDAALGGTPDADFASHLSTCAACAAELDRQRALAGRMDAAVTLLARGEPSPQFADDVVSGLHAPRRLQRWTVPRAALVSSALAAAALFALLLVRALLPSSTSAADASALTNWRSPTSSLLSRISVRPPQRPLRVKAPHPHSHASTTGVTHVS